MDLSMIFLQQFDSPSFNRLGASLVKSTILNSGGSPISISLKDFVRRLHAYETGIMMNAQSSAITIGDIIEMAKGKYTYNIQQGVGLHCEGGECARDSLPLLFSSPPPPPSPHTHMFEHPTDTR